MASLQRKYKRAKLFSGMNKQQRKLWTATHGRNKDGRLNNANNV